MIDLLAQMIGLSENVWNTLIVRWSDWCNSSKKIANKLFATCARTCVCLDLIVINECTIFKQFAINLCNYVNFF